MRYFRRSAPFSRLARATIPERPKTLPSSVGDGRVEPRDRRLARATSARRHDRSISHPTCDASLNTIGTWGAQSRTASTFAVRGFETTKMAEGLVPSPGGARPRVPRQTWIRRWVLFEAKADGKACLAGRAVERFQRPPELGYQNFRQRHPPTGARWTLGRALHVDGQRASLGRNPNANVDTRGGSEGIAQILRIRLA